MQRHDMRMTEAGGDLDLAQKTVDTDRGCELAAQDFERDQPVVLPVPGEIDRRHPAPSQLALDLEPAGQRRG